MGNKTGLVVNFILKIKIKQNKPNVISQRRQSLLDCEVQAKRNKQILEIKMLANVISHGWAEPLHL